jgi:hypothetical protein
MLSTSIIFFFLCSHDTLWAQTFTFLALAASHPKMFRPSTIDEGKLLKIVENHHFSLPVPSFNGDQLRMKISPLSAPTKPWCWLPSSNVDLVSPPMNSFAAFSATTRSSWFIWTLTQFFRSPSSSICVRLILPSIRISRSSSNTFS